MTLLESVKVRLRQFHMEDVTEVDANGNTVVSGQEMVFDNDEENPILEQLISEAKQDVITYRQYPSNFTEAKIEKDMEKFDNVIIKLTLYDYNKEGAEFESSNTQGGNQRTYVTRQSILNDVHPLISIL